MTYEPQWGSDVFGMYQSMVEGQARPWDLLVKRMCPRTSIKTSITSSSNSTGRRTSTRSTSAHNYLEPIVHSGGAGQGHVDKWIVYGTVDGKQLFSARELTVFPGGSVTIKDDEARTG